MNRGTFSLLGQLLGPSFGPGSTDLEDHLVTTPVLGLTFWSHAGHLLLYGRASMAAPSWLRLHGCAFMAAPFPCLVTAGSQSWTQLCRDLEDHLVTTPVLGLTFWSHPKHLLLHGWERLPLDRRTSMNQP